MAAFHSENSVSGHHLKACTRIGAVTCKYTWLFGSGFFLPWLTRLIILSAHKEEMLGGLYLIHQGSASRQRGHVGLGTLGQGKIWELVYWVYWIITIKANNVLYKHCTCLCYTISLEQCSRRIYFLNNDIHIINRLANCKNSL